MKKIISAVGKLKKGEIGKLVERRMKEFEKLGRKPSREIFKELCFCLLTANFNAERAIKI